jgi:NCAIR mutase (PurE)-related protein
VIRDRVLALLRQVADGALSVDAALDRLSRDPIESLPFATIDHHRALRQGYPEVIFGQGKTPEQVVGIAERLAARGEGFLVTRAAEPALGALREVFPAIDVNALGRCAYLAPAEPPPAGRGTILIVTAGTSDLPVAEEAAVTAGIHRVLAGAETLTRASVVIVVAGMDGALPSVVGGIVATPVIAVPTSVGYGASFGGVAALLAALNSCASGITVVNIDNGFGAAVAASRITHTSIP